MRSDDEAGGKHQIPVIDRMMELLDTLANRSAGASITELVAALEIPRTTVYRILNTLQAHNVVRRSPTGSFTLGPRLLALAARVSGDGPGYDLASLALPHLEQLSEIMGEGCKVSIRDGERALVLTAVQGKREYALAVWPGQHLPLHAGAASKILLAHMPERERSELLRRELEQFTAKTIVDPRRLMRELAKIRSQGWAQDKGEYSPSIQAFAAPIVDPEYGVVAALSIPFLTGATPDRQEQLRAAVIASASAISADLRRNGQADIPTRAGTQTTIRRGRLGSAP
jgi:DNA-binding IclR family transcriptional regulator